MYVHSFTRESVIRVLVMNETASPHDIKLCDMSLSSLAPLLYSWKECQVEGFCNQFSGIILNSTQLDSSFHSLLQDGIRILINSLEKGLRQVERVTSQHIIQFIIVPSFEHCAMCETGWDTTVYSY